MVCYSFNCQFFVNVKSLSNVSNCQLDRVAYSCDMTDRQRNSLPIVGIGFTAKPSRSHCKWKKTTKCYKFPKSIEI